MPDEFGNGNGDNGEYGELEGLREFVSEHGDDISNIVFVQMKDGDGYASVELGDKWFGFDLEDFDETLWQGLFDFINNYDIDYVVYQEN